jgi:putative phosphoesterase
VTADGPRSTGAGGSPAGRTQSRPASRRRVPARPAPPVCIGVISDNHGYLDPEVLEIFAGVTHIIHAGDIVDPGILAALEAVAPVTAVSGNLDTAGPTASLPTEATGEVGGVRFVVAHKPKRLLKRLAAGKIGVGEDRARPDLVVWGHLHTPTVLWLDGQLQLNPGTAASPDEEDDGPTVAIVEVASNGLGVRFIPLRRRTPEETGGRR